jgi:hypothetical protein
LKRLCINTEATILLGTSCYFIKSRGQVLTSISGDNLNVYLISLGASEIPSHLRQKKQRIKDDSYIYVPMYIAYIRNEKMKINLLK